MPQTSPMSWTMIIMMSSILLIMMISKNQFSTKNKKTKNMKTHVDIKAKMWKY